MQVRNETKGVMNVGGKVIAPGQTADVDSKSPGVDGAIKRGSLSRVNQPGRKPAESKPKDDEE